MASSSTIHSAVLSAPTLWLPAPASFTTPSITNSGSATTSTGIGLPVVQPLRYSSVSGSQVEQVMEIPETITGTYRTDYNILYVDQVINQKLRLEVKNLERLKFQKSQLISMLEKAANIVAYRTVMTEIEELSKLISDIESGERAKVYLERTQHLVEWYRAHHKSLNLVDIHQSKLVDDPDIASRLLVIEEYLEIASEYVNIQVTRSYDSRTNQCHGCGADLSKVTPNMEGEVTCPKPNCRTVHNMETNLRMPEIGDHVTNYNSGKDESIENFYKAAQRFQAEQSVHIHPVIYEKLEDYFVNKCGCLSSAVVRTLPLNSRGWRGNTSVQMLRNALDAIHESALGKHTILIGKNYWGWQPMKISEYMEQITADYNVTQTVFHTIPAEIRERNSSLGTEYRLWRHLQLRGCQCYFDMFMIAGDDSFIKHENIWKMMCEGTNDPAIRFINNKDPLPLK